MLIFNGTAFIFDNLIEILLILSFLHISTIIIDEFDLNIIKTNKKIGCIFNSDSSSEVTSDNGRKFPKYKNNYTHDN